jgi:hypothetical protein
VTPTRPCTLLLEIHVKHQKSNQLGNDIDGKLYCLVDSRFEPVRKEDALLVIVMKIDNNPD